MRRVLVNLDLPERHAEKLRREFPEFEFIITTDKSKFPELLKDTEVFMTFFECTREIVDMAPNLKWVQGISAGVDKMPLEELKRRNIILTNGKGIHRIYMAEYAIASMIMLARNFQIMFRNQFKHKWDADVPQDEIYGKTVGILGLGSIGQEIAKRASLFGMKVIGVRGSKRPMEYVDKVYSPEEMGEVFKESDYVINLLPSTEDTREVINEDYFNLMKDTACFINIGRGTTVNEPDLIEALRNKKMRAMVTDVFYVEPLSEDSPLWDLDNVILTPHLCGKNPNYMDRAMEIVEHNMRVYTSGEGDMINVINLNKGY